MNLAAAKVQQKSRPVKLLCIKVTSASVTDDLSHTKRPPTARQKSMFRPAKCGVLQNLDCQALIQLRKQHDDKPRPLQQMPAQFKRQYKKAESQE